MPTVCKITLDAEEYRKNLAAVVAETRAAAKKLDQVPAESEKAAAAGGGIRSHLTGAFKDLRAELNNVSGGAKKLMGTLGMAGGPIAIIAAGIASIGKIAAWAYEQWTGGAKEASELAQRNAANIRENAEANEKIRQTADGYLSKLSSLADQEKLSNASKAEALTLIGSLTKSYGDLGVKLDETTGKITGLDAALVKKAQRDKQARISEIESELKQIDANRKTQAERIGNAGWSVQKGLDRAGKVSLHALLLSKTGLFRGMQLGGEAETKEAQAADEALARRQDELRRQLREAKRDTSPDDLRAQREALTADQRKRFADAQDAFARRQADDAFGDAGNAFRDSYRDVEVARDRQLANRQALLDQQRAKNAPLEKQVGAAKAALDSAGKDDRAEAERNYLKLQQELLAGKEKEYALERQIAEINKQKSDAAKNLQKSLREQTRGLQGDAMRQAGREKEWNEQEALRKARETKGGDLTAEETASVKQLSALTAKLAEIRETDRSGLYEVKTNNLTARGGFAGGAVTVDPLQVQKTISSDTKRIAETLASIDKLVKDLGTI